MINQFFLLITLDRMQRNLTEADSERDEKEPEIQYIEDI